MEIDVFISYSSKEFNKALLIKEALSENDISVWMAPESIPIGSNYTKEIPVAIKNCKIFLLILSQNAQNSIWVPAEVENAYKNEKLIFPFIIEDCPLTEQFDFLLSMSQKIEAAQPPIEHRISELVEKVLLHLGRKQIIDKTNTGKTEYQLSTMKIYADKNFKGRDAELDIIHKNLMSDKNKFFIVGMGGCGKSELANRYCEKHSNDYENIIKITYSGSLKESIANDSPLNICGIVRNENLDKSVDEYFEYKLNVLKNITDERTLLVIDNFDVSEDEKLDELCSGRFAILFTTRNRVINNRFEQLLLDEVKLDTNEQFELFKDFYQIELEQDEIEIIMEILTLLDGHILSIRLVASTMNSNCIEPDEMLGILKNVGASKQSDVVYSRINKLMQLSQLSEEELYLLKNLSLVPLSGIKKKTFIEWCGKEDFETINGLIQKSWVIRDNKDVIHLHPIISDLAFEELSNNFNNCDVFVHSVVANYKNTNKFNYSYKQWFLDLTSYICERLSEEKNMYNELLFTKARVLHNLSLYPQAIELYEYLTRVFSSRKKLIFIYRELSHLYCMSGFFEKSMSIAEESIERFFDLDVENLPDEEIYIYKGTITRLAEAARNLDNYDYAINVAEKALEISTKYLPKGFYSSIAWGKYHLARALYTRGLPEDIEKSEQLFLESILNAEAESDDWTKNYCIEFLAQVKMKKGEFDKALNDTKEIYNNYTSYYGESGVDRAINRVLLGNIYRSMGNEAEAVKCYNEAIEIFHKCGTFKLEDNARCILNSGKIGYVS